MIKKSLLITIFFSLIALAGCAGTINVEKYPFGSPIHHVYNGVSFLDMGLNDDAFREFTSALQDDKQYSPGYAGKGIYWAIEGVPDVALGYIKLSLKYAGDDKEKVLALNSSMRVQVTLESEDWFDTVSENFSRIEEKGEADAQTYYWMGMALLKNGDTAGAYEKFEKSTELVGRYKRLSEQQLKKIKQK
jgi:tetratricopeptide (TPR) repeat protein